MPGSTRSAVRSGSHTSRPTVGSSIATCRPAARMRSIVGRDRPNCPTVSTRSGAWSARNALAAQHQDPVPEGGRRAVQVGRRLVDDRPAAGVGQGGEPLVVPAQGRARQVPGQDDAPGGQLAEGLPGVPEVAAGERWPARTGRGVARRIGSRRRRRRRRLRVGDQREAEPDVEVHRTGVGHPALAEPPRRSRRGSDGRRDGHPGRGAGRALGRVRILGVDPAGGAQVGEEPDGAAEELHLVDRLGCADAPGLDRPVGAEDHQRDRTVRGLHDGRREVGHGCARGADHGDRRPRDLGQAEGEEPGRALVDPHVQADPTRTVQAQGLEGQRGRARPGGEDDVAHALVDQLSQERPRQRGGRVHEVGTPGPGSRAAGTWDPGAALAATRPQVLRTRRGGQRVTGTVA